MIDYKFDVLASEIDGFNGLMVGDAVIPVTQHRIAPGGYQYDTWKRLDNGLHVDVRTKYRNHFMTCTVNGEDMDEIARKIDEVCEGVRSGTNS